MRWRVKIQLFNFANQRFPVLWEGSGARKGEPGKRLCLLSRYYLYSVNATMPSRARIAAVASFCSPMSPEVIPTAPSNKSEKNKGLRKKEKQRNRGIKKRTKTNPERARFCAKRDN